MPESATVAPDGPDPDPAAGGLPAVTVESRPELTSVSTPNGTYYQADGEQLAVAGQPVQPRQIVDVTRPGYQARGALITEMTSTDVGLPDPVYVTLSDD